MKRKYLSIKRFFEKFRGRAFRAIGYENHFELYIETTRIHYYTKLMR